jgi:hypothetical protein
VACSAQFISGISIQFNPVIFNVKHLKNKFQSQTLAMLVSGFGSECKYFVRLAGCIGFGKINEFI